MNYEYQVHGYKSGHQCLFSSVQLNRNDQDTIDRLSDISGPLKPNETFTPYLTCYPLPSDTFFVLARTWQDTQAARAGCVITKSLLVPKDQWQNEESSPELLTILLQASADKNELLSYTKDRTVSSHLLSTEIKCPVNELVEAVFIEKRQPIVFFNSSETDSLIYRLYSVLWPSLRGSFATCTFALSQRTIEGRPFDLLFAPISAKPRFNEWLGRRIDGQVTASRHRWTSILVNSIYQNNQPHLLGDFHGLPVSPKDIDFNENHFRLDLAWQELLFKAKTSSPYLPILGLLDIINSLKFDTEKLRKVVHPILSSAVNKAVEQLSPIEAWNFFASLLIRYKRKSIDRKIFESIKYYCEILAEKNPKSAIEFLIGYKKPIETIPSILFEGIGDGFAVCFKNYNILEIFGSVYNYELIATRLTASSSNFASLLIEKVNLHLVAWEAILEAVVQSPQHKFKLQAEKNLSLFIKQDTRHQTVEMLYKFCIKDGFELITKNILKVNDYQVGPFLQLIFHHATRLAEEKFIFDLLIKYDRKGNSDNLLALVMLSNPDFLWSVLHNDQVSQLRVGNIFNDVLDIADESKFNFLKNNEVLVEFILESEVKKYLSSTSLTTLLFNSNLSVEVIVKEISQFSDIAFDRITPKQLDYILKKLLKKDQIVLDQAIIKILVKVATFDNKLLFQKATQRSLGVNILLANIDLLFKINNRFNRFLSENVNKVSRLLNENLDDKRISNEIAQRWIRFLHQSEKHKTPYKEAAVAMLDFSFKCEFFDSTQLIAASFPIVYKSFLKGKPITNLIPMFSFPDWDKCRTLREDLVKLYLNRSWAKFGLLYIASAADILKETIKILGDKKEGRVYLEEAIIEVKNLQNKSALLKEISHEIK